GAVFGIRPSKHFSDKDNLACVVSLDCVTGKLKGVSSEKAGGSPEPFKLEAECDSRGDERQGDSDKVEPLVPAIAVAWEVVFEERAKHGGDFRMGNIGSCERWR
ncbi:MAG: hypothetical protein RL215_3231, partial [Planctomycetota bacterium]